MNIIISHMSGEPIYQQIINQIKTLILAGDLTEGEMLPSIRQLGKGLRISVIYLMTIKTKTFNTAETQWV